MATFPGAVKTFTNPISTDHMNTLSHAQQHAEANDEITAIETALGVALGNLLTETTWTDYSATSTITGWSSFTDKKIYTKKIGKTVFVAFSISGASNANSVSFTLPYASANGAIVYFPIYITDNGTQLDTPGGCALNNTSATAACYKTLSGGGWSSSNTKAVYGQFFYETA